MLSMLNLRNSQINVVDQKVQDFPLNYTGVEVAEN